MTEKRLRNQARKNRKGRSPRTKRAHRSALALAAAGTATAMALAPVAPTPLAEADIVDTICNDIPLVNCSFTEVGLITHPAMQIVALLYSIPFISAELPPGTIDGIPIIGSLDVNALIPAAINRFVWAYPLSDPATVSAGLYGARQTGAKTNVVVGVMDGALVIGQSIPFIQAQTDWPLGVNNYTYLLVRNGGRANGGIASRFDWLYSLTGQSAVSGNVQTVQDTSIIPCAGGTLCQMIPVKLDVALGYDSIDDFPVAPAPISILNSIMQSFLITNYLGERENVTFDAGNNNFYITVVPEDSALLEPIRLPGRPLSLLGLPDPFDFVADIFEPAADILINVGYNDVNLTTYERSFQTFNGPNKQFFIDSTLTLDQQVAAVGAAFSALFSSITGIFSGGLSTATAAAAAAPAPAAAESPSPAAVQQAAAVQETVTAAASTETAQRRGSAVQPKAAVVDPALSATDDAVDVIGRHSADAALEGTKAGANKQIDTVEADSNVEADTVKENLDAAADQARERAQDALGAARDRVTSVNDQPVEAAGPTPTAPATTVVGAEQANGGDADTNTSSTGGGAAG